MRQPQKDINILGVRVDNTTVSAVLRAIEVNIKHNQKFYIVTPNPEQVMHTLTDREYKRVLNSADISIPDGIGLAAANTFLELPSPRSRITRFATLVIQGILVGLSVIFNRNWLERRFKIIRGRELFLDIIKLANKKGWKIFFLGGEDGEAIGTKHELEKNYKKIKIQAMSGPMLKLDGTPISTKDTEEEEKVIAEINNFKPDFLFVGISHPRQEKWINIHYRKLNVNGSMAIGGTFRYVSGKVLLPPKIIGKLGLEWLWRLMTGSQKLSRIWIAFPKFAFTVFKHKLTLQS